MVRITGKPRWRMTVVADGARWSMCAVRCGGYRGWSPVVDVGVVSVTGPGCRRMDLRTVGRRVRTLAPYKSCRHYSVTPGLNLSRDRKLDADGNADLSDAKRSRVAPAYVSRVSRLIFLGSLRNKRDTQHRDTAISHPTCYLWREMP